MATKKHPQIHQLTISQFEKQFPDETACRAYLQANRWPEGVTCPRCGNVNVHVNTIKEHHWNCYACSPNGVGYRFSVLVGTIFENTNKPLRDWFRVMHMMLTSKKGISALQIYRVMGFGSYNTALLMCNKIRVALGNVEFKQLVGYVEVDETFVGGKAKNKHKGKGGRGDFGGTGGHGKSIVVGAVQRKGNVVARVIDTTDADTLNRFVNETVSNKVSLLSTDDHRGYRFLNQDFPHGMVHHGRGEYVCGAVHTNTSRTNHPAYKLDFIRFSEGALVTETILHASYFEQFGLSDEAAASPACHHYTQFLLTKAALDPIEVAMAAVLPCFWIYKKVGDHIYNYQTNNNNPYRDWITTYAGEDFAQIVQKAIDVSDEVAAVCTQQQRQAMSQAFNTSAKLEWMFWDSAWRQEQWPV